jgi:hypothetical protein
MSNPGTPASALVPSHVITPGQIEAWKVDPDGAPPWVRHQIEAGLVAQTPLDRVSVAATLRVRAEEALARAEEGVASKVRAARSSGSTWQEIATVFGVTTQAAQQRYGKTAT